MPAAPAVDAIAVLVGFARALRAAGVATGPDRMQTFLGALAILGSELRSDVYWAGRLTLCGSQDDLERYDRVFAAYFAQRPHPGDRVRRIPAPLPQFRLGAADAALAAGAEEDGGTAQPAAALASSAEVLRHRDMAELSAAERAQLRCLLAAFSLSGEPRRTPRLRAARRGGVDPRRTVRELLHRGGEPARLRYRAPAAKPRRVVLLLDVSGSMAPYSDALLRFAHAATHGPKSPVPTEVFTIGTRLTRVTREMAHRDPDMALAAVASAVPDWSGGTRLGEMLRAFLDRWGSGASRAERWSCCFPTGGSVATRRCSRLRCGACTALRTGWCGPTRARCARVTRRLRPVWRRRCPAWTRLSRGTAWVPWSAWQQ